MERVVNFLNKLLLAVIFGLLAFAVPVSVIAQTEDASEILSFTTQVDIDDSLTRATVTEVIVARVAELGESSIELNAAPFGEATFANLSVQAGSAEPVLAELSKNKNGLWQTVVPLPLTGSANVTLTLNYQVTGQGHSFYVPMIYPFWKPTGTDADLFQAQIDFPASYRLVESLPTHSAAESTTGGKKSRSFKLSAFASVLWLKFADEHETTIGTNLLVDIGVLLLLGVLAIVGWKYRSLML